MLASLGESGKIELNIAFGIIEIEAVLCAMVGKLQQKVLNY